MKKPAVPPRPGAKAGFLGAIETTMQVDRPADNMSAIKTADMTFKMDPVWHKQFKGTAVAYGMTMKELLLEAFEAWKREKKAQNTLVAPPDSDS